MDRKELESIRELVEQARQRADGGRGLEATLLQVKRRLDDALQRQTSAEHAYISDDYSIEQVLLQLVEDAGQDGIDEVRYWLDDIVKRRVEEREGEGG